jgi:hypothetical protein
MNTKNFARFVVLTVICVMALSYYAGPAFGADPGSKDVTCDISVTVDTIIEWDTHDFATFVIDLDAQNNGHIIAQGTILEGSATTTLWTNCNVKLSADNLTDPNMALLTHQRTDTHGHHDALVTKYKITTDGDGDPYTGATLGAIGASSSTTWTDYDQFIATPLAITHVNTDGNVEVTLWVQASNDTDNVADAGLYTATQTITAAWDSDN